MEASLRSKEAGQFDEAIERCFSLLRELGPQSPRFERVFQSREAQADATRKLQVNAVAPSARSLWEPSFGGAPGA